MEHFAKSLFSLSPDQKLCSVCQAENISTNKGTDEEQRMRRALLALNLDPKQVNQMRADRRGCLRRNERKDHTEQQMTDAKEQDDWKPEMEGKDISCVFYPD